MKIKYKFQIDEDVFPKPKNTAQLIMIYLNDPDGWALFGYFFEEDSADYSVIIRLSTPKTIGTICKDSNLSCATLGGSDMYINSDRWFHGAPKSKLSLDNYRQYIVSHEIGHILGFDHQKCPCKGCPAPIMMQQTLGIGQCRPNTKTDFFSRQK